MHYKTLYDINFTGISLCDGAILSAGVVLAVISFMLDMHLGNMNLFQRSGAIVLLAGVIVEYRNHGLEQRILIESNKTAGCYGGAGPVWQPKHRKPLMLFTHISVLVGTFICGYGDIMFRLIGKY